MQATIRLQPEFGFLKVRGALKLGTLSDYYSDTAIVLEKGLKSTRLSSAISIIELLLQSGDDLTIKTQGPHATEALGAMMRFFNEER